MSVHRAAFASASDKFFLSERIQNNAVLDFTFKNAGNRDTKMRQVVGKVCCAVNGVDNPLVFSIGVFGFKDIFLAHKVVVWINGLQFFDNNPFDFFVSVSDIVVRSLLGNLDKVGTIECSDNMFTGSSGGSKCHAGHGFHK